MTEDPEDVAPDVYPDEPPEVTGDPVEAEEAFEDRLEFLEEVWPDLEEGDPQRPVVAMEIVSLRRALEHLTEPTE